MQTMVLVKKDDLTDPSVSLLLLYKHSMQTRASDQVQPRDQGVLSGRNIVQVKIKEFGNFALFLRSFIVKTFVSMEKYMLAYKF